MVGCGCIEHIDPKIWHAALQANLTAHFLGFRFFNTMVRTNGSYVLMNGGAAEGLPQTGLTGICAYAVHGLCTVLHAEGAHLGLRVHELMLQFRVADGGPFPGMKSPEFGQIFVAIAAGKDGYQPGTTIVMRSEEEARTRAQRL